MNITAVSHGVVTQIHNKYIVNSIANTLLTHVFFSFFINPGNNFEGASKVSFRHVVCSKPLQNLPVGRVVIDRWESGQCLPQLLRYWEVLRSIALELSYFYVIL